MTSALATFRPMTHTTYPPNFTEPPEYNNVMLQDLHSAAGSGSPTSARSDVTTTQVLHMAVGSQAGLLWTWFGSF